jgi:hypothetical protein
MEKVMNHSEPNGEYPDLNWSGFEIPLKITPKLLFDVLVTGLLAGGLFSRTFRGALAFMAVYMIWRNLESRLNRIESKLSN